ncbi:MAG: NfeD family protein [Phycisphaerales bacterium]
MESYLFWGICLLFAATLLLFVEVFVPSMGLISLTAFVLAIAGVVCLFQVSVAWGVVGMLSFLVLGCGAFFFALRIMPHTPLGRRMMYGEDADKFDPDDDAPPPSPAGEFDALVGLEGTVLTDMRPVGTVKIGDQKVQAISETSLIRAGARVRVVSVEGSRLLVRPIA